MKLDEIMSATQGANEQDIQGAVLKAIGLAVRKNARDAKIISMDVYDQALTFEVIYEFPEQKFAQQNTARELRDVLGAGLVPLVRAAMKEIAKVTAKRYNTRDGEYKISFHFKFKEPIDRSTMEKVIRSEFNL